MIEEIIAVEFAGWPVRRVYLGDALYEDAVHIENADLPFLLDMLYDRSGERCHSEEKSYVKEVLYELDDMNHISVFRTTAGFILGIGIFTYDWDKSSIAYFVMGGESYVP